MRIACLQFDPQLGHVEANIQRADALLASADTSDLDLLDLLVLPELAFTGICISPQPIAFSPTSILTHLSLSLSLSL